jgi:anthranilate synthase component 1
MNIYSKTSTVKTDTMTPVGVFLNLRNHYTKIALLESNDYSLRSESKSFIAFDPLVEVILKDYKLILYLDNELIEEIDLRGVADIVSRVEEVLSRFKPVSDLPFNGFLGAVGFEFALYTEKHIPKVESDLDHPDLQLILFRNILVMDHFTNDSCLIQNSLTPDFSCEIDPLSLLKFSANTSLYFEPVGDESSSITDTEFKQLVRLAKSECEAGNVFQLVFSRDFKQTFFGDDFEVYRALRTLNPSPYLFYFDFETHRIMGSSPEAQLKIKNLKAEIHPIAGTVKKTGEEEQDSERIAFLLADTKENAEHTMLVDLARNDLSKKCHTVKIEKLKEVQQFSHVIHLVSKVTGYLTQKEQAFDLFADTFPAGTLSGTPKPRALELIAKHEKTSRDYYGGALGFFGFNGDVNAAITIRSILSKGNTLHFRAGAGIVLHSDEESELQEINNKLGAVRTAIQVATQSKAKRYENSSN